MSVKPVEYRPHVWPHILAAAEWYEAQQDRLGGDLVMELEQLFSRISENSSQFPVILKDPPVRRAILKRFPYSIYFIEDPSEIVVISVIHSKRSDRHWKRYIR